MIVSKKYEKYVKPFAAVFVIILYLIFNGGSSQTASYRSGYNGGSFNTKTNNHSGEDIYDMVFYKGDNVAFVYSSEIESGEIIIKLVNSENELLYLFEQNADKVKSIHFDESGQYYLFVEGVEASGKFEIKW